MHRAVPDRSSIAGLSPPPDVPRTGRRTSPCAGVTRTPRRAARTAARTSWISFAMKSTTTTQRSRRQTTYLCARVRFPGHRPIMQAVAGECQDTAHRYTFVRSLLVAFVKATSTRPIWRPARVQHEGSTMGEVYEHDHDYCRWATRTNTTYGPLRALAAYTEARDAAGGARCAAATTTGGSTSPARGRRGETYGCLVRAGSPARGRPGDVGRRAQIARERGGRCGHDHGGGRAVHRRAWRLT